MNNKKKIYLALTLFLSVVLVFGIWFMFDNKENTLNDDDNSNYYIAAFIDGESSSTFPTSANYITEVVCKKNNNTLLSINATASWTGTKWKLSIKDAIYANIYCNVNFITKTTWESPGEDTLLAAIKRDNTVGTPLTTPGRAKTADNEAVLASAEDDYGTSYYFRGAVTNNYVQFANKCWRIVRVGGDGSVKLILHNDNTAGAANPCNSANNSISAAFAHYHGDTYTSAFNTNKDDNTYVGFMYGTPGSSTYAATHANTNKSTILTNLENWYNNNLKTYESVIDNSVWCNDKTNVTDTSYNPFNMSNVNGLGYAKNVTYYGATQRLVSTSGSAGGTGPSLKCNGELSKITSKIGLITADELALAGYAGGELNSTTYLQENATDYWWWSLSPCVFRGVGARVWGVDGGRGGFVLDDVNSTDGVRPSISLKSTTNVSGDGTSSSPYKIVS